LLTEQPAFLIVGLIVILTIVMMLYLRMRTSGDFSSKLQSLGAGEAARWLLEHKNKLSERTLDIEEALADKELQKRWDQRLLRADPDMQTDIVTAVSEFGGLPGRRWLIRMLNQNNPGVQFAAAARLTKYADHQLLAEIIPLLASKNPGVPARVAEIIMAMGKESVEPLLEHMQNMDEEKELVIHILGELGAVESLDQIIANLHHPRDSVRKEAVIALGKLATDQEGTEGLIAVLRDENWQVRAQAARVSGLLGVKEAVSILKELINDSRWEVSTQAEKALKALS